MKFFFAILDWQSMFLVFLIFDNIPASTECPAKVSIFYSEITIV